MPEPELPNEATEQDQPTASEARTEPSAETATEPATETATEPATASIESHDPTGQVFVAADDDAPPALEDDDEPRPSALRTATVVSARIVIGCVSVAAIGALVAAAILVPLPSFGSPPESKVVTPVATAAQLVCPGGLLRLGSSTGTDATAPSSLGSADITSAAVPGTVRASEFASSDAGTGHTAAAPWLLSAPAAVAGAAPATVSGAQSEQVATDDFAGLAAAACTAPVSSTWLSGGSTTIGRTTLLMLANPSAVAATVSIRIFGEVGQVTAPGMDGIVVRAGSQRVLSIAGFAPNVASPVVHVTSTGGQIVATLEQTTVRGLIPGGLDFVGGQVKPVTTAVIPGVVVSGSGVLQSELGQSGFDDLQSTLRVFDPGQKDVTVSIETLSEDGSSAGKPTTTRVPAGRVTDLPLDSLSEGTYTVVVTARTPIVASVRVSAATDSTAGAASTGATGTGSSSAAATAPTDFAWSTAAPLLLSSADVSVPSDLTPLLSLMNPTDAAETVHVDALGAQSQTVTVPANSATTVTVAPNTSYVLHGFTKLYAAVSGTTDGGVTSYVVSPPARGDGPIRVF